MDSLIAVAASMLPVSRVKAAAFFKELVQSGASAPLDGVLEFSGIPADSTEGHAAKSAALAGAAQAIEAGDALGICAIPLGDSRYPALLSCISEPPPVLWVRGDQVALTAPSVAVIGSRAASPYALQVGRRVSAELAERGIVVVSGLARGVDSAAHEGCLAAEGRTIAVIGSGLDNIYPREHEALADRIAAKGLVVSELAPHAKPLAEHFPLRNRIISGISLAVVVVEASEKSGSLITASWALRQGRDVMAVPGSVLNGRNRGSHALLKDGAKFVETADDILEDLGWSGPPSGGGSPEGGSNNDRGPNKDRGSKKAASDPLLAAMDVGEVYRLDDLVEVTGTPAARLLPRLMQLELLGLIEAPGGGRFVRPAQR
jgi:DNA processing protein